MSIWYRMKWLIFGRCTNEDFSRGRCVMTKRPHDFHWNDRGACW